MAATLEQTSATSPITNMTQNDFTSQVLSGMQDPLASLTDQFWFMNLQNNMQVPNIQELTQQIATQTAVAVFNAMKDKEVASKQEDDKKVAPAEQKVPKNAWLYKTTLCNNWEESGFCPLGSCCLFAHGAGELRKLKKHPKYKTKHCRTWQKTGACKYGDSCQFIHDDEPKESRHFKSHDGHCHSQDCHKDEDTKSNVSSRHAKSDSIFDSIGQKSDYGSDCQHSFGGDDHQFKNLWNTKFSAFDETSATIDWSAVPEPSQPSSWLF